MTSIPSTPQEAYPLFWPASVPRTPSSKRQRARFSKASLGANRTYTSRREITISEAVRRLMDAIRLYTRPGHSWRIDPNRVIISTNLQVRLDGLPRSGQREPDGPGAAVYFYLDGNPRCIPCDRWDRVADNVAAIAGALGAMRDTARWVNEGLLTAVFTGFLALPAPKMVNVAEPNWREVLRVPQNATLEQAESSYRQLASS
jgi:hypothetical protein